MSELKPCPFCGGDEHDVRFVEVKPGYGQIGCEDCEFWFPSDEVLMKEEAIRRWNTRAERTCRMIDYDADIGCGKCSNCGHVLSKVFDSFCSGCGAKVVE